MIFSCAYFNAAGKGIGSVFAVEFELRELLDSWIAADLYTLCGVWKEVEVAAIQDRGTQRANHSLSELLNELRNISVREMAVGQANEQL